jgi:putative membrane protein
MEDRKMNNKNEVWIVLIILFLVFLFVGPFMFMGAMMGPGMMGGWHMGQGMMGYGYGFNWIAAVLQTILFVVFLGLIIFGVYYFIGGGRPKSSERSLDILKERYAKGEITKEEYDRIKRELTS